VMRGSYTHHYRRMLAPLLKSLRFGASNAQMLLALDLLKRYAGSEAHNYAPGEVVPLEGIVPAEWRELVVSQTRRGQTRINRIAYEMCVLSAAREGLRCRSIWLAGARRYRNPDEDLPADFAAHRQEHCARLGLPSSADEFIAQEKKALAQALADLNRSIRRNPLVTLQTKNGKGRIAVTPLSVQAEPMNWARLKGDVNRNWEATSLLDMLKETELRTQFTQAFHSATAVEKLDRRTLQRRLLLCLYGLGTNAGLKSSMPSSAPETRTSGARPRPPAPPTPRSSPPGTRTS
jgi:Tn3 transposase DDE domain